MFANKTTNQISPSNKTYRNPSIIGLRSNRVSFRPIITPKTVIYVSGVDRITQFIFDISFGLRVIIWGKDSDGNTCIADNINFEWQIDAAQKILDNDIKFGRACLTDSSNFIGGNKRDRRNAAGKSSVFTMRNGCNDDISAIVFWINNCERKINKLLKRQKKQIDKANELLDNGFTIEDLKEMNISVPLSLLTKYRDEEEEQIEENNLFTTEYLDKLLNELYELIQSPRLTAIKNLSKEQKVKKFEQRLNRQLELSDNNFYKYKAASKRAQFAEQNDICFDSEQNISKVVGYVKYYSEFAKEYYSRYKHFKCLAQATQERINQIDNVDQVNKNISNYFCNKLDSALSFENDDDVCECDNDNDIDVDVAAVIVADF